MKNWTSKKASKSNLKEYESTEVEFEEDDAVKRKNVDKEIKMDAKKEIKKLDLAGKIEQWPQKLWIKD